MTFFSHSLGSWDYFDGVLSSYVFGSMSRVVFYVCGEHDIGYVIDVPTCCRCEKSGVRKYSLFVDFAEAYLCAKSVGVFADFGYAFIDEFDCVLGIQFGSLNEIPFFEFPFKRQFNPVFWDASFVQYLYSCLIQNSDDVSCFTLALTLLGNLGFGGNHFSLDLASKFASRTTDFGYIFVYSNLFYKSGLKFFTERWSWIESRRLLSMLDNGYALMVNIERGMRLPAADDSLGFSDVRHVAIFLKTCDGGYFFIDESGVYNIDVDYILDFANWSYDGEFFCHDGMIICGVLNCGFGGFDMLSNRELAERACASNIEKVIVPFDGSEYITNLADVTRNVMDKGVHVCAGFNKFVDILHYCEENLSHVFS